MMNTAIECSRNFAKGRRLPSRVSPEEGSHLRIYACGAAVFFAIVSPALGQGAIGERNTPAPVAGQTNPWPVSKMIGLVVYNAGSEPIGKITDLVMGQGSCIATAILSVGGYLGGGERYVQVPLETIRFPRDSGSRAIYPEKAVINTTKDAIAKMPVFKY